MYQIESDYDQEDVYLGWIPVACLDMWMWGETEVWGDRWCWMSRMRRVMSRMSRMMMMMMMRWMIMREEVGESGRRWEQEDDDKEEEEEELKG